MESTVTQVIKSTYDLMHCKRVVLVGKAASGKDHCRKLLEDQGFTYQISYTTRPPRTGEVNGKDYYFVSEEEFMWMIREDEFYEWVPFNGWYYGTSRKQMESENSVFIMTPSGLSHMSKEDRTDSFVVYFNMPIDVRKQRLALRSDADTVDRRIEADERDFSQFTNFDYMVTDPNFS